MRRSLPPVLLAVTFLFPLVLWSAGARAAGGPLGIDHRLHYDDSGIWSRHAQKNLMNLMIAGEIAGGVFEGGETRLGRTFWQSIDASALGGVSSTLLKLTFTRSRPSQTDNPNQWFEGRGHYSFPSGEVTAVTAIVTPFVLEYRHDEPAVYALELLPAYDAVARMKTWGHWQTDVLAGFALGTAAGYLAHERKTPFILSVLPDGVMIGMRKRI